MPKKSKSSKITRSHSTQTETSKIVVDYLDKMKDVSKISLGIIKHVPGGRNDITFQPITGGIKAAVRGNGSVHELYIYTNNPEKVKEGLFGLFKK